MGRIAPVMGFWEGSPGVNRSAQRVPTPYAAAAAHCKMLIKPVFCEALPKICRSISALARHLRRWQVERMARGANRSTPTWGHGSWVVGLAGPTVRSS